MENEATILSEPSRFKLPTCEVCREKPAVSFSFFFQDLNQGQDGAWKLCCDCTSGTEDYYILFDDFFSEEAVWLAHLGEKRWMDWGDWQAMMRRFPDEAELDLPSTPQGRRDTAEPIREDLCQCGKALARAWHLWRKLSVKTAEGDDNGNEPTH